MTNIAYRAWRKASNLWRLRQRAGEADAFLASFPKSGRTWFRFILSNYFNQTQNLGAAVTLHSTFSILPNFALDQSRGVGAFGYQQHRPGLPLILVSHFDYNPFLFQSKPVIFMIRDPRDVMVSAYFHATQHKHRFSGDIETFLRHQDHGVPVFCAYLNGWAKGLRNRQRFILSYEKLQADPAGLTAEVIRFLGRDVDERAIAEATAASQFEAMRDLEMAEGLPDHDYDRGDAESLRMRRGKAGGYVDYLSAEQTGYIESTLAHRLSPEAKSIVHESGLSLA